MRILLLSNDLVRRFGKCEIDVDSGIANVFISKGMAQEIKELKGPPLHKMMTGPGKSKDYLFPNGMVVFQE